MPRPVAVLRLIGGSNAHVMTPWFIDIGPSITFEWSVFVVFAPLAVFSCCCGARSALRALPSRRATALPVVVLRLMAGTNTRGLTPWLSDIGPSIIFESAVFTIGRYLETPLALSLQSRTEG